MADTRLYILENTEVLPAVIKQESFTSENVKNDCPLNGEYALDLKSPEFDLENIATECSIDSEQTELLNNSNSAEILPRIKRIKWEPRINKAEVSSTESEESEIFNSPDLKINGLNVENLIDEIELNKLKKTESENCNPADFRIKILSKESLINNLEKNEIELNKSEEILPRINEKKVDIGIKDIEPRINKSEGSSTESEESEIFDPSDLKINGLDVENLIDEIELNKLKKTPPRIEKEKVEVGIENMEPGINKAEGSGTDSVFFYPSDLKIKDFSKESSIRNLKNGEIELMQIESMKTESSMVIKEEEFIFDAVGSSNTAQNQNVRFNIMSKHSKNNVNINSKLKSKSDTKNKSRAYKSKNKLLGSKMTQVSSVKPIDFKIKILSEEISINNLKTDEVELNKSKEILPRLNEEKVKDMEPIINRSEGSGTESDESEMFDPPDLEINGLNVENLLDEIELKKIPPRIKKEKVEVDIENMEPGINKAEGSGADSELFYHSKLKIKDFSKEISISNLKKDEIELMQIETMKTESSMIIKEEEFIFDAVSSSNTAQNPNVRFNLMSKHSNNNVNINSKSKSKSDTKNKSSAHKSKNKLLGSKMTQISSAKPKTGSGEFECPYCGYKCKYDAIFQDHLLSHTNTLDMFSCRICNFKGKSKQHYYYHMDEGHEDDKMLTCGSCDYKNTCENQFRIHLTEKGHKVKCPKCDLEFDTRGILKRHLIEHETKIYECSVCKKLMKYKNLKSHLLTHTAAFECKICGYKTSGNKRLKDHMKVHTKEKPYECTMCTKSFRLEFGLKNHMLSHQNRSSRKLYECNVCKKTYLSHQALKLHFKKKNHGSDEFSMETEGVLVKRTKIINADKI